MGGAQSETGSGEREDSFSFNFRSSTTLLGFSKKNLRQEFFKYSFLSEASYASLNYLTLKIWNICALRF